MKPQELTEQDIATLEQASNAFVNALRAIESKVNVVPFAERYARAVLKAKRAIEA